MLFRSQPNLCSETVTEIRSNASAIHSLRRRGETQEDRGRELFEDHSVTRRWTMVHFIDHDEVVEFRTDLFPQPTILEHFHGAKQVLKALGCVRTDQQFSKIGNSKNGPERSHCLFEDFPTMRDVEESRITPLCLEKFFEIKGSHYRFSGPCGSDHEIPPLTVNGSLSFKRVEDTLLKRVRPDVEKNGRYR